MLSTSARIRVRTSSFLRAAARHKSEAKLRSIRGAARTSYRPDTLSRLRTNIKLHDWRSMSRSLRPASRAPQAQCRQSMLRRRRPPTCGRRYRAPRSWPPSAKRRSRKLSPSSTTSVATPVWAMVLRAPHRGFFDTVARPATVCGILSSQIGHRPLVRWRRSKPVTQRQGGSGVHVKVDTKPCVWSVYYRLVRISLVWSDTTSYPTL